MSAPRLILHLSHTDIRCDARILKELDTLRTLRAVRVEAIGVDHDEGAAAASQPAEVRIDALALRTRGWRRLHGALRHALNLLELGMRMVPRAVSRKPAVVHCHDALVLPIGALIKILTGCALVYDAHELESRKNGQSRFLSRATLAMERACWHLVDVLVSVSPAILAWYAEHLGPRTSVLVLNAPMCPAGVVRSAARPRTFHERFGIAPERKVFVYLGLLAHGRGIPLLLDAFGRADSPSDIVFVGYRDVVGVAEAARRLPHVHLHPPVPHDEVVSLVRAADFGVCLVEDVSLSDRLCLPNKLFEYVFAGLPVLASDLPEIRRVVDRHGLGVWCAPDPGSVAHAVERLRSSSWSIDVAALGELGWQTQAERLREAYRSILGP